MEDAVLETEHLVPQESQFGPVHPLQELMKVFAFFLSVKGRYSEWVDLTNAPPTSHYHRYPVFEPSSHVRYHQESVEVGFLLVAKEVFLQEF